MALAHFVVFQSIPEATGQSSPVPVGDLRDKWVQVWGTFSATAQVQGRMPGGGWEDLGSSTTTPALIQIDETVKELRIDITVYVSGTVQAQMGGFRRYGGSG
jgi:hypothetical protein